MNQESRKIKSFTDLETWQIGHSLTLEIYRLTKSFPKEEIFSLTSQLRRAVVSFTEVQNQLLVARDVGYVSSEDFKKSADRTVTLNKMTNSLIKKSRSKFPDS